MENSGKDDLKLLLALTLKKLAEVESVAKIGTWEFNLQSKKLTWSDQMYKIFEFQSPQDPSFEEINNRIHFADRFHWDLLVNRVSLDGNPGDIEIRLIDDNNEVRWIRKTAKGVFDEHNRIVGIRGFCQDVTDLKKLVTHFELTKDFLEK